MIGCRNQRAPLLLIFRDPVLSAISTQLNNPILTQPIRFESRLVIGFLAVGDLPGYLQSHLFVGRAHAKHNWHDRHRNTLLLSQSVSSTLSTYSCFVPIERDGIARLTHQLLDKQRSSLACIWSWWHPFAEVSRRGSIPARPVPQLDTPPFPPQQRTSPVCTIYPREPALPPPNRLALSVDNSFQLCLNTLFPFSSQVIRSLLSPPNSPRDRDRWGLSHVYEE